MSDQTGNKQYIIIAGNIGAGKSTLVEHLCSEMGWKPYFEPVSENPYLKDFYSDMARWGFHSQLFFLADRMRMHRELQEQGGSVVQDRSIYEDAEIFARNLFLQGNITERDYETYRRIYTAATDLLQSPDLLVYLQATVPSLLKRIAKRGRDFESAIPEDYLGQLNGLYDEWTDSYTLSPKLTLNIDEYDILNNPEDLSGIAGQIKEALRGGQGELF